MGEISLYPLFLSCIFTFSIMIATKEITTLISRTCSRRLRQKIWRCGLFLQPPAVVAVVNHLAGHTAVYADVLARDETCLVAT